MIDSATQKRIFGPIPSRRLGMSLGVDLMLAKTCSLDCIYCECGQTTDLTLERKEYVDVAEITHELDSFVAQWKGGLDWITFSGFGEPTLHSRIDEIIEHIKNKHPDKKIALLTNSTLFTEKEVRKSVLNVDLVSASLDGATERSFAKINRPHPALSPDSIIDGLVSFRGGFTGALMLEIFIVPGINDTSQELAVLKKAADLIRPDRFQINTLDRPGTVDWVVPASHDCLKRVEAALGSPLSMDGRSSIEGTSAGLAGESKCSGEILTREKDVGGSGKIYGDFMPQVLEALKRRPLSAEDIAKIFGFDKKEVETLMEKLLKKNIIEKKSVGKEVFYTNCHGQTSL